MCTDIAFGQKHSDLYLKVDSIVRYQLKFNVDSAMAANNARKNIIIRDAEGIRILYPLILLNGNIIDQGQLDLYHYNRIKKIEVWTPNDAKTGALYGSRGSAGVIFISAKK